ncbi:twin-arginine translocation signal domain-containing protein [Arachidicoccus ginsenosidivorans]|uniref:Twin-arginine translocation signal domain-containing protein n=1 Tax=Arachidicoccus ginsenosidivorans TaxID=496057 RepID=A0A5B8VP43_9BACT|nr:twin-arginine translocation signal domain-containing protein [Arachidicoccus ginsenosidivorans]QEC72028.1 twin-arginine translocation signal domain-containing protein [Arachidicoccus ginsenosidivorans]
MMERRNFLKNTTMAAIGLSTLPLLSKGKSNSTSHIELREPYQPITPQIKIPRGPFIFPPRPITPGSNGKNMITTSLYVILVMPKASV